MTIILLYNIVKVYMVYPIIVSCIWDIRLEIAWFGALKLTLHCGHKHDVIVLFYGLAICFKWSKHAAV